MNIRVSLNLTTMHENRRTPRIIQELTAAAAAHGGGRRAHRRSVQRAVVSDRPKITHVVGAARATGPSSRGHGGEGDGRCLPRNLCMHMCMHMYMHMYMCMYMCMYVMCINVHVHVHVMFMFMFMYVCYLLS